MYVSIYIYICAFFLQRKILKSMKSIRRSTYTTMCAESHCRQGSSTLKHAAAATTLVSGATVLSAAADAQGTRCYQLKRLVHPQREAKNTKKHANKTKALIWE